MKQLPTHLFVKTSNRSDYVYRGVYFINSLIQNNRSIELINANFVTGSSMPNRKDDSELIRKFKSDRRAFFTKFYLKDDQSIIGDRKLTETDDFDPALIAQTNQSVNNMGYDDIKDLLHDYIEDQILFQKIGDVGEKFVYDFEVERVKSFAPQLVKSIHKPNDSSGYDLNSFQQIGTSIRNVQIEIKTTTNKDPYNAFFMSKNEYQTMCDNPSTYWLYRVFDINAKEPRCFALRDAVSKKIEHQPKLCLFA